MKCIQLLIAEAKKLPKDQLLGDRGQDIAMDICGSLAFQDAEGVTHDGWFNQKDEAILHDLLDISGALDADPVQYDEWQKLFGLSEELR